MDEGEEWMKESDNRMYNYYILSLPVKEIGLFQKLQNSAIRLVLKKRKRDYVTPLLSKLHLWVQGGNFWVPSLRLHTSLIPFSFALHTPRTLQTSSKRLLKRPKRNLKYFGQRSFSLIAPSVWNSLPAGLRNFTLCLNQLRFSGCLERHFHKPR